MLQITCTEAGGRMTIELSGDLALETVDHFQAAGWTIEPGTSCITVDCQDLAFIDSTGMNALLQSAIYWRRRHLSVDFANLAAHLREMLEILGFFEVLAETR